VVNPLCGVSDIDFKILVRQWRTDAVTELSRLTAGWYSSNHNAAGTVATAASGPLERRGTDRGFIMRMGTQ
jgi:hypothetical protein